MFLIDDLFVSFKGTTKKINIQYVCIIKQNSSGSGA